MTPSTLADVQLRPTPPATSLSWRALVGGERVGPAEWVALGLGLAAGAALTLLALARHRAFASGQHDLEIYLQVLWNTAQGQPFATTLLKSNELHLAEHLALTLLPLAPLYALWPAVELAITLQQALVVLAGLPIWLVARRRLGAAAALLLLVGFYLLPPLAGTALDDFHAVALTSAPLAAATALLLDGRWRSGAVLALASVLLEEEAALLVAGLGVWQLLERRWRLGGGLFAAGTGLLLLASLVVMPAFHHPATLGAVGGNRSLGHFAELRREPAAAAGRLLGDRGREAALNLLLPVGGTALLAPTLAAASAPTLAALLLQNRDDTFQRHWVAPLLPLLWLAAAVGLARLRGGAPRRLGLLLVAAGSLAAYGLASPLPGGARFEPDGLARGPREAALGEAVAAVPPGVPLAASANVVAHLANRPAAYVFPIDDHYLAGLRFEQRPVEAYLLDLQDPLTQRVRPLGRNSPLLADPPFVAWSSGHKVLLLTRQAPTPATPSSAVFNRRLSLVGYDLGWRGETLRIALVWEKTRDIFADFDRLAEVVDGGGRVLARERSQPLGAVFSSDKWRVGQVIVDRLDFPLGTAPAGLRLSWLNHDRDTPMPLDTGGTVLELALPAR